MAPALVQNKAVSLVAGTSHAITLTSAPVQGNLVIAVFAPGEANATSGNSGGYVKDVAADRSIFSVQCWSKLAGASESATITFTTSGSFTSEIEVMEFSGMWYWPDRLDKSVPNDPGAVTVSVLRPGTTGVLSQASEVAITAVRQASDNGGSEGIDTAFTVLDVATLTKLVVGYKIVSATTALDPQSTWNTARQCCGLNATYKAAVPSSDVLPKFTQRRAMKGLIVR